MHSSPDMGALCLTLEAGTVLHLGGDCRIEIKRVSATRVAVTVYAPKDVVIWREEVEDGQETDPQAA